MAQGNFTDALKTCEANLKACQEVLGADHLDLVPILWSQAEAQIALGRVADSVKTIERAKKIRTAYLGTAHPDVAAVDVALGRLALDAGDFVGAAGAFGKAADALVKDPGSASPEYGQAVALLGLAQLRRGECAAAKAPIQAGLDILFRHQHDKPAEYVEAMLIHAEWLLATGDAPEAEAVQIHSALIHDARVLNNQALIVKMLTLKTKIVMANKNLEGAANFARKAVERAAKVNGEASLAHAEALTLLGAVEIKRRKSDEADKFMAQAIAIRAAALAADQPGLAANLKASGLAAAGKEGWAQAEKDLRAALAAIEKNQADPSEVLFALATVLHRQGKIDEAEKLYDRQADLGHKLATSLLTKQTDFPLIQLAQRQREALDRLLSLPETPARNEANYRRLLQWKGAAADRAALLRAARDKPELAPLFARHEDLVVRLATVATRVPYGEERTWWFARVEALTDEWERLEAEILSRASLAPPKRATLEELQKALPEKSVLIDMVEFTQSTPPAKGNNSWNEQRRLVAFIVRPGQPLKRVDFGSADYAANAIQNWRDVIKKLNTIVFVAETQKMSKEDQSELEIRLKDFDRSTNDLHQLFWPKLADAFEGVATAYIAPDGELAKFPFGALMYKNDTYLIKKCNPIVVHRAGRLLPARRGAAPQSAMNRCCWRWAASTSTPRRKRSSRSCRSPRREIP